MRKMNLAVLVATAAMSAVGGNRVIKEMSPSVPRRVRNYPRMLVSSPAEIAAHNKQVKTRQVLRRITWGKS